MAQKWMLKRGDKEHGPMSSGQLKKLADDGKLKASDQVQVNGGEWKLVASIPKLFELLPVAGRHSPKPEPPPLPAGQLGSSAKEQDSDVGKQSAKQKGNRIVLGLLGCGGLSFIALLVCGGLATVGTTNQYRLTATNTAATSTSEADFASTFDAVEYEYDFSGVEYGSLPVGARKKTVSGLTKGEYPEATTSESAWHEFDAYVGTDGTLTAHGLYRVWFTRNKQQLYLESWYLDGRKHGVEKTFYQGGKPEVVAPWVNGNKHGVVKAWHETGQPMSVVHWADGNRHGSARYWDEKGVPVRYRFLNQNVVQGPSTDFNEDGSVLRKNFFDKNGDLHGETLVWGGPGWPKPHKFSYSHGKLHGRKQLFDKDGNLLLDVTYHEGKLDQPMRPASGNSRSEMIAVFAPVGVVDLRAFRDGDRFLFVRIDKQELFELIGEPDESVSLSDYDNIPSLVRYMCRDGSLYFVWYGKDRVQLHLVTSMKAKTLISDYQSRSVVRSNLFRRAVRSAKAADDLVLQASKQN